MTRKQVRLLTRAFLSNAVASYIQDWERAVLRGDFVKARKAMQRAFQTAEVL